MQRTGSRAQRTSVELVGQWDDETAELVGQFQMIRQLMGRGGARAAAIRQKMTAIAAPQTEGSHILATKQRRRYLPLGTVAIAAAGTGNLTVQAQGPIQGERLILTTDAAAGEHTVTDITIGYKPQLLATPGTAMPIEMFAADATGSELLLDPLKTGQSITVGIASTAAGATNASGGLIGVTAD